MTTAAPPAPRTLRLRGDNLNSFNDYASKELLLDGPAGTGKTSALLCKLYAACANPNHHGVRCLLLRKTRRSLTESGLVTFERDILGPLLSRFGKARREQRHAYHFPNASELVVGGLDDVGKIMSSDFDLIGVLEATECEEDEIEMLTTRLRNGRYGAQQLIMDCNPSYPSHWLNQRALAGRTRRFISHHEDNPALYDLAAHAWTARGRDYMEILDKLTGPRKKRLKDGQWVQAEGLIYTEWNPEKHLRNVLSNGRRLPSPEWPVELWVDFGFSARHPMVILWATQDPKGDWFVYRELHESGRLVEDIGREARQLCLGDGVRPRRVICDHDLEDRKTLERYLEQPTTAAVKDVIPGIQAVAARLHWQEGEEGKPPVEPTFFILRDSLVRRDPAIMELKRPCSLAEELDGYVWSDNEKKDEPVKDADDSCDGARYGIYFNDRRYRRGWRLERL